MVYLRPHDRPQTHDSLSSLFWRPRPSTRLGRSRQRCSGSRRQRCSCCWFRRHHCWPRQRCCRRSCYRRCWSRWLGPASIYLAIGSACALLRWMRRGLQVERGGGGGGVVQTSSCASVRGTLVCCRSVCSARRRGAPLGSERLLPRPGRSPALSARVLQRFALERCAQAGAARRRPSRLRANNARPSRVPPRGGGLQDIV